MALLVLGYFALPSLMAQRVAASLSSASGLAFASHSSHFEFSPPGLVLEQASLTNKAGQVLIDAETLHLPFSALGSIVGTPIAFENAGIHGYAIDGREHFSVAKIYGSATLNADGSLNATGTGDVGLLHVGVEASILSLARVLSEGSPADFNLSSKAVKAGYSGRLKLSDGFDLAGTMNLETTDTQGFLTSLGANLPVIQQDWPLNFTAALETKDDALAFSNIEARLGGMKALGNASYSTPGGRPKLTLDLGMDVVDLSLFGLGTPATAGAWREKSFDLAGLDSLDAVWRISSNGLRYGKFQAGPGEFDGSLNNRILDAGYTTKVAQDFSGHFTFNGQGFLPAFDMSLNAQNLDGKSALTGFTGFAWLDGKASVSAKLSTSGESPASMVSRLAGTVDVSLSQAQVSGVEAQSLLQSAAANPVDGWNGGTTTGVDAQATLTFSDGIGKIDPGSFKTSSLSVTASGDVDLLRQALELKVTPSVAAGAKPASSIIISGPWAAPKFLPDKSP